MPSRKMPVLFIGHGNPRNTIEPNEFRQSWEKLGQTLPRPQAILCISAHWETPGVWVSSSPAPKTIHDFYGFPPAMYDLEYPAPGDPELAHRIAKHIDGIRLDPMYGRDHGAWSVLLPMYPNADIPIVQLSLDTTKPGKFHYELAQQLQLLREEGILIIGSGNIVHNLNLGVFNFQDPTPLDWAVDFNALVKQKILTGDHQALMDYETLSPQAQLAIPTPEHYYPLLYALALQGEDEPVSFFNDRIFSSIAMTSVHIGT